MALDPNKWQEVEIEPIRPIPPPPRSDKNPYLRTTIPANQQLQPDLVKQQYTDAIPQIRVMPLQANASPAVNAAAQTISKTVAKQVVAGGVTSVGLTMPSIFVAPVSGSPVTSTGTLAPVFTSEPQNTFFAGPVGVHGNAPLDFVTTTGNNGSTNLPNGPGTGQPYILTQSCRTVSGNDLVYFLASGYGALSLTGSVPITQVNFGSDLWKTTTNVPGSGVVSVTGNTLNGTAAAGIFVGVTNGSHRQANIAGWGPFSTGTLTFNINLGSNVLAGSTILVFIDSGTFTSLYPGLPFIGITDNQGNTYTQNAQNVSQVTLAGAGGAHTQWSELFSTVTSSAGALTLTLSTPAIYNPGGLNGNLTINLVEVINPAPPVFTPTFRGITFSDLPGFVSGNLQLSAGGTGSNLAATGGAHQVLQQSSAGAAVSVGQLAFTDISGNIAVTQVNSGTNASSSTFFRGDNTWAVPSTVGGVSVKTANYTAVAADAGKLLAFNTVVAPTFVQGAKQDYVSGTSAAKAFTSNNTAGNMIVVLASNAGTSTSGLTISDTRGNTYVPLFTDTTANGDIQAGWYALNIGAGANTVTVSWTTGAVASAIAIEEWSNVLTVGALDQSGKTTGSGNWATSSLTTTQAVEVLQAFVVSASGITSTNSPFTQREALVSGGTTFAQIADNTVFSTGTYQATGNASGNYVAFLATFKSVVGVANYTLTLPAVPPSSTWTVFVENIGGGTLAINPNSLLLDNSASNIVLDQNQGTVIFTDGTNYFSERGSARGFAPVDLTAQTAAITTTTLYPVPASGAGQYRLSWNAKVTTVAGTSSTLGPLTIVYTDPDAVVQTITAAAQSNAGVIETSDSGNLTTTVLLGLPLFLNCKASTNITYAFAYASNAAAAMNYNLHIKLEAL